MKLIFAFVLMIFMPTLSSADNSIHSHGGRTHSHPLPKQGIKHRHGNGAYGISASGQGSLQGQGNKQVEQYTSISVDEFKQLISNNTLETTIDNSFKIVWIIPNVKKIRWNSSEFIYRFSKKPIEINFKEQKVKDVEFKYTGSGYTFGSISAWNNKSHSSMFKINRDKTLLIFPLSSSFKLFSKKSDGSGGTRTHWERYSSNALKFNIIKGHPQRYTKLIKTNTFDDKYFIANQIAKKAYQNYNVKDLLKVGTLPRWTPDKGNSSTTKINGNGKLYFDRGSNGYFTILGSFNNGLIKHGKLEVYNDKSTGILSYTSNTTKYTVSQKSNIRSLVLKGQSTNKSKIHKYISKNNSSSSSASVNCFGSGLSEGSKNLCLGISKHESSYCFGSGLSEGRKNLCLGASKRESSYCFGSGLSEGNKNLCLALSKGESNYCFGSGLSEGMKNLCLGGSKRESSYCFGSGLSEGNKNLCLAISKK